MRYYVYNNTTGLIESGGGKDQTRNQQIASTNPEWAVVETPVSVNPDKKRVDLGTLQIRDWTQAEIDARAAAEAQKEQDRIDQAADISSKISSKTRAQIVAAVANAGFTAPQTSLIEKMAIAIWAGAKLDGR